MSTSLPLRVWIARLMYALLGALVGGYACWLGLAQGRDWPPYQAESILLIDRTASPGGGTNSEGIEIAQRTLQVAIREEPLRSAAVGRLDGERSVEGVTKRVRVEVPEGVPMIKITATDADPLVAAAIADAFAAEAAAFESPLGGGSVLAPAKIPESPVLTSYLLIVVAAMVGVLVAGGAVWLTERFRREIRTANDAEALTDVPFLGSVGITTSGRLLDGEDHDWVFVRLMNGLDKHQRTVLFTSPRDISSQSALLQRLVSTGVGPAGIEARIDPQPVPSLPNPQSGVRDGSTYHLEVPVESSPASAGHRCSVLEILDGPPILATPATVLRAPRFDAVVLVLEAGTTRRRDADQAAALLREAGANLAGSVLVHPSVRLSGVSA